MRAIGFWSYVHLDDEAEGGRIVRLAQLIQTEYAMLTAEEIAIFVDRDELAWGDAWKSRIDDALQGTTFFIPVVTPRYFKSPECRRELLTFDMHAGSRGVRELLLPLLYTEVPDLNPGSEDEAVALVARTQFERWTGLRLLAESSTEYRHGVNKLALRLAEIAEDVSNRAAIATRSTIAASKGTPPQEGPAEEEPGLIDVMAEAEEAMPRWNSTINNLAALLERVGTLAADATQQVERSDTRGKGFAGRLLAARALAARLQPLATTLLERGTMYASDLVKVDSGILTLIRLLDEQRETLTDEQRQDACDLFDSLRTLAQASRENVDALKQFIESIRGVAQMSRDLRPPLRDMETGLRRVLDGQAVIDEWARQIDNVDLDCGKSTEAESRAAS